MLSKKLRLVFLVVPVRPRRVASDFCRTIKLELFFDWISFSKFVLVFEFEFFPVSWLDCSARSGRVVSSCGDLRPVIDLSDC